MRKGHRKPLTKKEKAFAKSLANGTGSIKAARLFLKWKCGHGTPEAQKAKDLARSPRIREEVDRLKNVDKVEAEAEMTIDQTPGFELEDLRKFAYDRLKIIAEDSGVNPSARWNAVEALEKLNDPSKDINLIYRYIDIMWRYYEGHCPACHKDFPLWKIQNNKLEAYREENGIPPSSPIEDRLDRRLALLRAADPVRQPHPGQVRAISAAERHLVGTGPARGGKATAPDTPILTPKGFVRFDSLRIGDTVFDEAGQPCQVIGESPVWKTGDWYRVIFDTGEEIIAHENHEWVTHQYNYREAVRSRKGTARYANRKRNVVPNRIINKRIRALTPTVVSTKDIFNTCKARETHTNHAIPVSNAIQFPAQDLPIDPYLLGVWLGDDTALSGQITIADQPILDKLHRLGHTYNKIQSSKYCYRIHGLYEKLVTFDLKSNKHIPLNYLYSSYEQRLELLRGLMDTDGYINKNGNCAFYNTNKNLCDGVMFLLASLGIKRSVESKVGTLYGVKHKTCYIVKFTTTVPIFSLERKAKRLPATVKSNQQYHYIVDVKKTQPEQARCIEVNSPSNQYLVGKSLIPTHNSFLLGMFLLMYGLIPGVENWLLARIYENADKEFQYYQQFLNVLFYPVAKHMMTVQVDRTGDSSIKTRWGNITETRSGKAKGSITGHELEIIVVAEPAWVEASLFEEVRARMSSRMGRIIAFGTPKGFGGFLYRMKKLSNRGPDGHIRNAEERLIRNGCPWNQSLAQFSLSPEENPQYVISEKEAARGELTREEYESEFEGRMTSAEGARFPLIQEQHVQSLNPGVVERLVYVLGIDQGPKNFGGCLIGWDGQRMYVIWEFFDDTEKTIKANMMEINRNLPAVIAAKGGTAENWQLTIFDSDPPIHGILLELIEERKTWKTDETYRPKNLKDYTNWREETMEWINYMAGRGFLIFDKECDQPCSQLRAALIKPLDNQKERQTGNDKGWLVKDPWRGDHVMDAFLMACFCIKEELIHMPMAGVNPTAPFEAERLHQEYQRINQERRELTGKNDNEAWRIVYGHERTSPAKFWYPQSFHVDNSDEG